MTDTGRPPSRATIDELSNGVYMPMAMLAGMQLDLFTPLADGSMTAAELAAALGVGEARLAPLLYALVVAGLLTRDGARFANTAEADHYLVRGRPDYAGGSHELLSELWEASFRAGASIRTGVPQTPHDFAAMTEDELEGFLRGGFPGALATGRMLAADHGLDAARRLLDVAGGSGGLAIGACEAVSGLTATVVDLPTVTPFTRRFVDEAGLSDRIRVVEADITLSVPEGPYDAATMRAITQVLPPRDIRKALVNVGNAMAPGGALHIVGRILDDSRLAPVETVCANLHFLSLYEEGQAQTEGDHRAWLDAAGFTDIRRIVLAGGTSLISARKG